MNLQNFDPGPRAQVEGEPVDGRWTLGFVRDVHHAPEKVWAALTDPQQLSEWSPFSPDRPLTTVGPATFRMVDGDTVEEYAGA